MGIFNSALDTSNRLVGLLQGLHRNRLKGIPTQYEDVAELTTFLTTEERPNIADGAGHWLNGQQLILRTEGGAVRLFFKASGGVDAAADAAASHARNVRLPNGFSFQLLGDANAVLPTVGAPSGGSPVTGDRRFDIRASLLYTYNGSAWDTGISTAGGSPVVTLTADRILTAADDGIVFRCAAAYTITVPAGLSPRPTVVVDAPPSGNVTIASSGGVLLNGATTSITRNRASNPAGFAIVAHGDADSYGIGGA